MWRRTEPAAGLLVATLIATLLAAAAAALISSGRATRSSVQEGMKIEAARARAQAIAEAAIVRMDAGATDLKLDGTPMRPPLAGEGTLQLQDAGGLVDINQADPPELAALFRGLGFTPVAAATFADRIADWRDPTDFKRLHGANNADYVAADLPMPGHRPFATERELEKVMGMGPALAACLEPYVTVYSAAQTIDRAVAPAPLKRIAGLASTTGSAAALGVPIGHVIIVTAKAPISKDASLELREWVRLTADPARPFMVHRASVGFASQGQAVVDSNCTRSAGEATS